MTRRPCKARARQGEKARPASLLLPGRVGVGQPPAVGASRVLLVAACTHACRSPTHTHITHRTLKHLGFQPRRAGNMCLAHDLRPTGMHSCPRCDRARRPSALPSRTVQGQDSRRNKRETLACLHVAVPVPGVRQPGPKRLEAKPSCSACLRAPCFGSWSSPGGGEALLQALLGVHALGSERESDHITQMR